MPKRPSDENGCPDVKRNERTENEERLAKEREIMNKLFMRGRSSNDERKKQQKSVEVKILERRNEEIIIESIELISSSNSASASDREEENEGLAKHAHEQKDEQVGTPEVDEEMANINMEKEQRKSGGEDNANVIEEVSTLRDEVTRLQRHVATLKHQKRKAAAKNEELMANKEPQGDAALHAKEKEKMKKKIKDLMVENKKLTREKEKRELRKQKREFSKEEFDSLKEDNEKLVEELKESLEIREKLNATVNEFESSNAILTKQLDWYKKGWLTFHEFAREEMNKNAKEENQLGPDSISMPPEQSPLCGPPPYDIPYYPPPSPVYDAPVYNKPVFRDSGYRTPVYTPVYSAPLHHPPPSPYYHPPPSPYYHSHPPPLPSPAYSTPFHPPPPPPSRSYRTPNRRSTSSFNSLSHHLPRRPPPHQFKVESPVVKTEMVDEGNNYP